MLLSVYTSSGTILYRCSYCGEIVAEYATDANGIPTVAIFDNEDTHRCEDSDDD